MLYSIVNSDWAMNSVDHADQTSEEYEQEQERKHFCRIVNAFKSYK